MGDKIILKRLVWMWTLLMLCSTGFAATLEERVRSLESSMVDVQISSLMNKLYFSGELTNIVDRYATKDNFSSTPDKHYQSGAASIFTLNANSTINRRLSVYSSMQAAYFYGESILADHPSPGRITTQMNGDSIRLIKAYFDFHLLSNELIFSMGRLPTTLGPPMHYYSLDSRLGTYPLIAYSMPFDGLAATWNISETLRLPDSYLFRAIYSPQIRESWPFPGRGEGVGNSPSYSNVMAQNGYVAIGMLEFQTKRFEKIASSINMILQYIYADFGVPETESGGSEIRSVLSSAYAADANEYEVIWDGKSALRLHGATAHLDFLNVFKSNFDLYYSQKITWLRPDANITAVVLEDNNGAALGGVGTKHSLGKFFVENKKSGSTVLVGSRFNFSSNNAFGAEYYRASLGSINSTFYTGTNTWFYNAIGKGYHAYYTHSIFPRKFNIRVGYSNTLANHVLNTLYQFVPASRRVERYYAGVKIKF